MHLARAPRALWSINLSYLLEGLAYFGILTILGKYLSENVGLADTHAGWVYGALTGGITFSMLILGGVADRIGVRRALLVSLLLMVVGRAMLGIASSIFPAGQGASGMMFFVTLAALMVMVVGYGMYQPAAYAGIKEFTNKKTSAIGYAMIYALMNLGAFVSGIISPPIRNNFGMSGIYWVYVGITAAAFLSVLVILTRRTATAAATRVKKEDAAFNAEEEEEAGESKSDDEGDEDQGEAKDAEESKKPAPSAPQRPLLEPATLIFGVLLLAATGGLLYRTISTPKPVAEQALEELSKASAKASGAKVSARATTAGAMSASREKLLAPRGDDLQIDLSAFSIARLVAARDIAFLRELPAVQQLTAESPVMAEDAKTRARLRAQAVIVMAAAYGLVAPVDAEVLEGLQRRLKRAGKAPVPLNNAERQLALTVAAKKGAALPTALASQFGALSGGLEASLPAGPSIALRYLLRDRQSFYRQAAKIDRIGDAGKQLLLERLLADALLLRTLGDRLAGLGEGQAAQSKTLSGEALIAAKLGSDAGWYKEAAPNLANATKRELSSALSAWTMQYGIFLGPALILLVLLVWRLLALRPEHPFHNVPFTFFIFVLIPVQTLFAHNWLTLPYYINRAFAGTTVGENFEFFSNLNPLLIFFLTPLVAALTASANVYRMMIWGTLVMAAPTFLLVLPPNPTLLLVYIVLMSFGEAMWQPRFLQLVAEIAPEGKTGAYMGIAQLPWFLTKLVTATYAGYFVGTYCPKVGPQNNEFMWLVYACIAMVSPIALWMAKGWIASRITEKH